MHFDLIIVGSGPAAWACLQSYLEARSTDDIGKIAILEAGPAKYDGTPRNGIGAPSMTGQPHRLNPTTAAGLGGTSNLWHGVVAPLDPEDFEYRPHITQARWPINLDDLWPWYAWVAQHVGWAAHLFHPKHRSKVLNSLLESAEGADSTLEPKLFLRTKPVLRAGDKILELVSQNPNIELFVDHHVLEIEAEWTGEAAKVTHVIAGRPDGTKVQFATSRAILCAGALQSPRILLNSMPEWHQHNPKTAAHVGKYLMDHPMGPLFQVDWGRKAERQIYVGTPHGPAQSVVAALRPSSETQTEKKLTNTAFYLRPSPAKGEDQASEDLKLALLTVFAKLKRRRLPFRELWSLLQRPWLTWQVLQFKLGFDLRHRFAMGYVLTEQRPISESRVSLSDRRDRWGYLESNVHWAVDPQDHKDLKALFKLVNERFAIATEPDFDNWASSLSSAAHHLGTCRMADKAENGVVDRFGSVFGTKGLYVADGSTFVTSGNVNSTFTIMANAARIAREVASR